MASPRKVLTVPNALTALRGAGIPLFLWLFLSRHNAGLSFLVLALGALTDYLDGKLARWLDQESALGAALDPAIDRAYIAATVISMAVRDFIPWWLVIVLLARDLWMAAVIIFYKKISGEIFVVTFLGKAATFNLLYAFPLLLLQSSTGNGRIAKILGWSFALWGIGLYLYTAIDYTRIAVDNKRSKKRTLTRTKKGS